MHNRWLGPSRKACRFWFEGRPRHRSSPGLPFRHLIPNIDFMSFCFDFPPHLRHVVDAARSALTGSRAVQRLWEKDYTLWKAEPTEIVDRLGWLTVIGEMQGQVSSLTSFSRSIRDRGIRAVSYTHLTLPTN